MEVKRGYKQTEVGIVPEEWEIKSLYMLADKIMIGIASAATHAYQNIKRGFLDDSDVLFIAEENEETYRNKRLKSGDLLTARTGYPGTTCVVPEHYEGAQSFTTLITRPRRDSVHPAYLCSFINSEAGQRYFDQNQIGGGQKNVNAGSLKFLPIPLPPTLAEQEAIATALSDADAWIESLEQLIAKKRQIKQGAMQELLTSKRRLPGFEVKPGCKQTEVGLIPKDWKIALIEEIAHITTGSRNTQDRVDDGKYPFFVRSQTVERINSYSFDGEAVLTAGDGVGTGKVFHYINGRFDTHQRVYRMSDFRERVNGYFFFLYFSRHFYARIMQMTAKSSVDSVRREMIARMQIPLPPTQAEQEAIATALSDMDTEIAKLETKLCKARQIKQGMMQELLTGRIRLI